MSMDALRSNLAAMAQLAADGRLAIRYGTVSTPHDTEYSAKVTIEPEGIETDYIPVGALWAGNGWGVVCRPPKGAQVLLAFADGDVNSGAILCVLFSDQDRPPDVPEGEFWVLNESGGALKFQASGVVELTAPGGFNVFGRTTINGALHVTDDVQVDKTLTATTDVIGGGKHLKTHTHGGVQAGAGHTAAPD